ncbi:MAG TPA: bifunctional isocitrate dehydrogenase kinase/phosphatase [Acidimicrobiia bacterium]|nr:bifunctional isocitrate dehydrogenase kinase/phosphatase [Acidimicrobiia bacterium]
MATPVSDSRLSNVSAARILEGFDEYLTRFGAFNARAPRRFAQADWRGMQSDAIGRLKVYSRVVSNVVDDIRGLLGPRADDPLLWVAIKAVYSGLIADRQEWELAETFHNSITRQLFDTVGVDDRIEFVDTDFDSPPSPSVEPVYRIYDRHETTEVLVSQILDDFLPEVSFKRMDSDAAAVAARIEQVLVERGGLPVVGRAEVVRSVFYRGQSAYIVGLVYAGSVRLPVVLSLRHEEGGVVVDAVLLNEDEVSILFSFTRSYFHVDVRRPYDLVRFLRRLMPRKRIAELYISIGQNKHGKTERYRDLLRHLNSTNEKFHYAPGTQGLVMVVFTMPGYDDVFKVIRDRFPPPKRTTRDTVMGKYRLVFQHDRAGRLIDAQDFQHLQFEKDRFDPVLLEELLGEAGRTVRLEGDTVVLEHLYVERRVIPLDLYAREAVFPAATRAVVDYGQAIKDLACTNIFPGDLLTKNFGVTRHGRVVFYDYDELSALTDVKFKDLPEPQDEIETMSETPWYGVGGSDIFPEEHQRFLGMPPELKEVFLERHADLFEVEPWQTIQKRIEAGELMEVFPYDDEARLPGTEDVRGW